MKGLVISLAAFVVYVIITAIGAHMFKPERHGRYFFPAAALLTPVYILLYILTPANCWFLPENWLCPTVWADFSYGLIVYLLNVHSYIDFFFGFNGGFSTSLVLNIYRNGKGSATTDDVVSRYIAEDGTDKIYGWRLPALQDAGYLLIDPETKRCTLTPKGRLLARITYAIKRCLNLGAGG